ncbi:MAG: 4Fe-4S binding protein [Burkholderiales bacterium]|nr:4Fe-4S binding protein [Burkholderiales bacterium]
MALEHKTLKLCSCNRSIPLDAKKLARALGLSEPPPVHVELCRKEAGAFQAALAEPDVLVACTQEARLFAELAQAAKSAARLSFANIRELAGWSSEAAAATPKIAALLAVAALPEPEPAPVVAYKSAGSVLVIGPQEAALDWAQRLAATLEVSALITSAGQGELPPERGFPVWSGRVTKISGWLGAFEVEWRQENPIDLELCTRCNACIAACPEGAIGFDYQVDLGKCKAHRKCVAACGAIGAVDFARRETARKESFDLVFDLSREPAIRLHDPPQGYFAPGADPLEQALAAARLVALVGEFEKPRFVQYRERLCAHSRSAKIGCTKCLDVCSTGAISHAGDNVNVEAHLCAGCGGCATVCPSGALAYQFPSVPDIGRRLKTLLSTYAAAGGRDACVLFFDHEAGRTLVLATGRRAGFGERGLGARGAGRGLPARILPLECFHPASIGMDVLLGALAYGASQVRVLATGREAESYLAALRREMGYAQAIANALGYVGAHFGLIEAAEPEALERELWALEPAQPVAKPGAFDLAGEKRRALDFAIDHLARHAPTPKEEIDLAASAPFGTLLVDRERCTLCKACVGACPASALIDTPDAPRLRFIERNCVQCGLCAATCPEDAIRLKPRLLLAPQAKEPVTLNEDEPFHCVRCGKPFGTRRTVERMAAKLASHAMFAGEAGRRLRMCGDCRVADMMLSGNEPTIFDYTDRK